MKERPSERFAAAAFAKTAAAYAVTAAVCVLALVWVLKLWRADLGVPFMDGGDALLTSSWIKGVIDNGWYLHNSFIGAPAGLDLYDYPMAENLHFLMVKGLSLFTSNYALVVNLYFLGAFPLTALTSLFVLRRLNIAFPLAAAGSLLYTFLPYHFLRGEWHLFLSATYVIPLSALVILRIFSASPPLIKKTAAGAEVYDLWSLRTAGFILVALLTASTGIYYAFFTGFFVIVAGVFTAVSYRSLRRLIAAGIVAVAIIIFVAVNLSPSIINMVQHGRNEAVAPRFAVESELLGTTVGQLVLPVTNHRIGLLREWKAGYVDDLKKWAPNFIGESDFSSLGFIISLGFLFSLGWLFLSRGRYREKNDRKQMLDSLGVLNMSGLLLATVGGFGLLFAMLVTPEIRAYTRISVFIAFFSVIVVLLVLEALGEKYAREGSRRLLLLGALTVIVIAGILDQTTSSMVPAYDTAGEAFARDAAFVNRIEDALPGPAMVFQLPYAPFPESGPTSSMGDYDQLRGYLHSQRLHWSYGAMKGREGDLWQKEVSAEPTGQLVRDLAAAGFTGVYVNRKGYQDGAVRIQQELEQELRVKPAVSEDSTLLFFDMTGYVEGLGQSR